MEVSIEESSSNQISYIIELQYMVAADSITVTTRVYQYFFICW